MAESNYDEESDNWEFTVMWEPFNDANITPIVPVKPHFVIEKTASDLLRERNTRVLCLPKF
jgi:hypothetical protein